MASSITVARASTAALARRHPGGSGHHLTWYVWVEDIDAALKKIESLGGKTINPPMNVPGGPTLAHFEDPAGNFVGLVTGGPEEMRNDS
jgi:predicted enzyme related to lactoylglutathione lyase